MQIGFYFDQSRCIGCGACQVACKDWHDLPAGPRNWMRVLYTEMGKFPDVFVSYLIAPCYHCQHPTCGRACPVAAIEKRAVDGIVVVDSTKCLGNIDCPVKCLKACPCGAPQFGEEKGAKMSRCKNPKSPDLESVRPVRHSDPGIGDRFLLKQRQIPQLGRHGIPDRIMIGDDVQKRRFLGLECPF